MRGSDEFTLRGHAISPGMAEGFVYLHSGLLGPIDVPEKIVLKNVDEEISRLDVATAKITDDLIKLASKVEKEIDVRLSEVFGAHKLILNDAVLRDELRKEIIDNLVNASSAVKSVFLRWEKRFLLMESQIARDKGDDFHDISIRLRNALAGITAHPLEAIPDGCILVTSRLMPSDTVFLSNRSTRAVLLEYGASGSHAALFARQMGLPCISGIPNVLTVLQQDASVLVDAHTGVVRVNPTEQNKQMFHKKVADYSDIEYRAKANAGSPAMTRDGVQINVQANIGCHEDAEMAMANGAEGVGLYRLEQAYIGRTEPPDVDALVAEMHHTLLAAQGRPVTVRLLDIGADKPFPFISFLAETNPALGRRGIRLLRAYPDLLKTQLLAILTLQEHFDIQILIPMVTLADDVSIVRDMLKRLCRRDKARRLPNLGAMIETPAAALSARAIAKYADFISIGTNDLTQYAFAADRENASVEHYFNDASEVIFRLLSIIHDDVPDMPLSVCGELAGRKEFVARLLGCGVRTLSVGAPLVPIIKETVRSLRYHRRN